MSTLTPPKLAFVDFAEFAAFDQELLREIIREGEREMDARLVTANAADQRALTIAGFQLTLVIALTGATYALAYGEHPNLLLATITAFGVAGLGIAAYFSLFSVAPKKFKFPGNSPETGSVHYGTTLSSRRRQNCEMLWLKNAIVYTVACTTIRSPWKITREVCDSQSSLASGS